MAKQDQNSKVANLIDKLVEPNVASSVNGWLKRQDIVEFTVVGNATPDGELLAIVDGTLLTYTTLVAPNDTPTISAINAAAQWQTDLDAAFAGGEYTVTSPSAGVIKIVREGGDPIFLKAATSTDSTQSMSCTFGFYAEGAMLFEQQTAGTGSPVRHEDGSPIAFVSPSGDRTSTISVRTRLDNHSAGVATVRWRIWWWVSYLGWVMDQEVGIRTITSSGAAGTEFTSDELAIASIGAEKVSIELVDNGAAGNLGAGVSFSCWAVNAH